MNINQIMKQAEAMQKKLLEAQQKHATLEYTGHAGGGMVEMVVNGKHDIAKIKIDPTLLDPKEVEILEDLLIAAFNDAKKKADEDAQSDMNSMLGGMGLPSGFKLPF